MKGEKEKTKDEREGRKEEIKIFHREKSA